MKINAISFTTFGNKSQIIKKAATGIITATGTGLAADTFVKGLSKPDKAKENEFLKGNDSVGELIDFFCCDLNLSDEPREDCCCEC